MEYLFEKSNKLTLNVDNQFKRSIYNAIDWNQRLIELKGSRGVGKTTLMLQKAKEVSHLNRGIAMYISLDDSWFFNHSIVETADEFSKYGGKYLFIDEVHKYPSKHKNYDWSAELKNIYDSYPELNVIYSGSSLIELYKGNGDLSRRKSSYKLGGLSFREYLEFNNIIKYQPLSINDIISNNLSISNDIITKIKILPLFKMYLKNGYYPFYNENPEQYYERINNVLNLILEIDISTIAEITQSSIMKIKKMLSAISSSVPYTPNLTELSRHLDIADLRTLYRYLGLLETAELITMLRSKSSGNKILQKPDKIFIQNTNLIYALQPNENNIGTVRETFFLNQLKNSNALVHYPKYGDFIINNELTFEVGGKNKNIDQVKHIEKSFLALDDIETGFGTKIPLWLFGFLY